MTQIYDFRVLFIDIILEANIDNIMMIAIKRTKKIKL